MKTIEFNIYSDLARQLFYIEREVAEAKKAGEQIRLQAALDICDEEAKSGRINLQAVISPVRERRINDATIKALMHSLAIHEYAERGLRSTTVEYTLAEITKEESDFFTRNWGKFVAAIGLPTVIGGGIGAGLLGAGFLASFIAGPIGPLAYLAVVGVFAVVTFAVSLVTSAAVYSYNSSKETDVLVKHSEDIAQGYEVLAKAQSAKESLLEKAKSIVKNVDTFLEVINQIQTAFPSELTPDEVELFELWKNKFTTNLLSANAYMRSLAHQDGEIISKELSSITEGKRDKYEAFINIKVNAVYRLVDKKFADLNAVFKNANFKGDDFQFISQLIADKKAELDTQDWAVAQPTLVVKEIEAAYQALKLVIEIMGQGKCLYDARSVEMVLLRTDLSTLYASNDNLNVLNIKKRELEGLIKKQTDQSWDDISKILKDLTAPGSLGAFGIPSQAIPAGQAVDVPAVGGPSSQQ